MATFPAEKLAEHLILRDNEGIKVTMLQNDAEVVIRGRERLLSLEKTSD